MIIKTIFAGSGGQGVLMMGYVFAVAAMRDGKYVTYLPSYGAEVRGGTANCTVVVSDEEIASPVASSPDCVVVMNKPSMLKYQETIKEGGLMVINSNLVDSDPYRKDIEIIKIPANDIANELGNSKTLNMIMLGAFSAKSKITTPESLMNGLTEIVKSNNNDLMRLNRQGLDRGTRYALGDS
jgi:2-oxoglutarate ferredoxin oxidoreductase subunit gamma